MKFTLILLATFFCCCATAAVAQDPTCEDFEVDEPMCESPCSGSPIITNMIVLDNGAGTQHIEYQTFTCSNSMKQNRCNQTSSVPIAVDNPACSDGGGGGGGTGVGNCPCLVDGCIDGETCVVGTYSCGCQGLGGEDKTGGTPRLRRDIAAAQRRLELDFVDLPIHAPRPKPQEVRQTSQNHD